MFIWMILKYAIILKIQQKPNSRVKIRFIYEIPKKYLKHHGKKKWNCFVNIKIHKAIFLPACRDLKEGEGPKKNYVVN